MEKRAERRGLRDVAGKCKRACHYLAIGLFAAAFAAGGYSSFVSNLLFLGFFGMLMLGAVGYYLDRERTALSTAAQMSSLCLFGLVFWLCALRETVVHHTPFCVPVAAAGALVLAFMAALWTAALFKGRGRTIWASVAAYCRENAYVFIILALFCAAYLECFTFLFKSDSNVYYTSVQANEGTWNFSLSGIASFQIAGHAAYGYSLFAFLGNYILRIYGIGLRLANLGLTVVTVLCLNDILRMLFPGEKKLFYALLLGVFACSPLVMGLAQEMSADMPMACFLVWFVWAFMRRQRVYGTFFAGLLCFTKENAVVMLFGFMAGVYLCRLFRAVRRHELKLSSFITVLDAREWLIVAAPLLFLVNMRLYNSWNFGGMQAGPEVADPNYTLVNTFCVNLPYIVVKLRQMFVMNFQWLVFPLAALGLVLLLVHRKEKRPQPEVRVGLVGAFCGFVAFQLLFFTYPHFRYLVPNAFFFTVFAGAVLSRLKSRALGNVVLAGMAGAFLVQSFYLVDPITNATGRQISTGGGQIVSEAHFIGSPSNANYLTLLKSDADAGGEYFRDYVQNDRQYLGFERCFEKFMRQIDYSQDMGLVMSPIFDDGFWGGDVWTFTNMLGSMERETVRWNEKLGQLTYEKSDTPIHWLSTPVDGEQFKDCSQVWYIELPYKPGWDYEGFLAQFDVQEEMEVSWGQWSFNAYRVELASKTAKTGGGAQR